MKGAQIECTDVRNFPQKKGKGKPLALRYDGAPVLDGGAIQLCAWAHATEYSPISLLFVLSA